MTEHIASSPSPAQHEISDRPQYNELIARGLEQSRSIGFDLSQAIGRNHAEHGQADTQERERAIVETATNLAESAQLDADFFDRPAHTVLLMAVADSWIDNQARYSAGEHGTGPSVESEKAMLEDALFILAGEKSGYVRDMVQRDPAQASRFAELDHFDPDVQARAAFFESINDTAAAAEVQRVLAAHGDGSFLGEQQSAMGHNHESEQPFRVKVLNLAPSKWDMISGGMLEKPQFPDYGPHPTPEVIENNKSVYEAASRLDAANETFAAPFVAAQKEYDARFREKFGDIPVAYVTKGEDGTPELFLKAMTAHALIEFAGKGKEVPGGENARDMVRRELGIVKHEYGHTQRSLAAGVHGQLGLIFEERKAEQLSGDTGGYADVKAFVNDISYATNTSIVSIIGESVKHEDALSHLVTALSNQLGLRTTLLMMAAKPLPYDKMTEYAKMFANVQYLMDESDASSLDAIVRDVLERHGDKEMRQGTAAFIASQPAEKLQYMEESFIPQRRMQGLGHSAAYMAEALAGHARN